MTTQSIAELKQILEINNVELSDEEVVKIGEKILELYQIILTNQKTNEQ